mgnify:CR=1 FL=1
MLDVSLHRSGFEFRRIVCADTGVQSLARCSGIRIEERCDRIPVMLWRHHPVRRWQEPPIGPQVQEFARVDDNAILDRIRQDPISVAVENLQTRFFGQGQHGEETVVAVRRDTELIFVWFDGWIIRVAAPHDGIGEIGIKEVRRLAQGQGIKRQQVVTPTGRASCRERV